MGEESAHDEGRRDITPLRLLPRILKAAVFQRRSAQKRPAHSLVPPTWVAHTPSQLYTTPLSQSPAQATHGLCSLTCPPTQSQKHVARHLGGLGAEGPKCIHTCCFHLSSTNNYWGPTVCQAPFRIVPCGFPMIFLFLGTPSVPSILWLVFG